MKAILVVDISDDKLKKYNESLEDLTISYSVNGNVENYVEVKCSHSLKPIPEEREDESCHDYDCFLTHFIGGVGNKSCYRCGEANGYNDCIDEILGEEDNGKDRKKKG